MSTYPFYSFWILLWLSISFVELCTGQSQSQCMPSRCSKNGPAVRFPFRLRDRQPAHCGYPGFELSCRGKHTVLELPIPSKFFVESIDYKSQVIKLYDPEDCLMGQLLKIHGFSVTPLGFFEAFRDYTMFNCSVLERDLRYMALPCLSGYGYQVFAVHSNDAVEELPLAYCTKMYHISSVPHEILAVDRKYLRMNWTRPDCSQCEAIGNGCRLNSNSTESYTECFVYPKSNEGNLFNWFLISSLNFYSSL